MGRGIFGALGNDVEAVLKLAAKGYAVSANTGGAEVRELQHGRAVVHLREIDTSLDSYPVGGARRGVPHVQRERQRARALSTSEGELHCEWRD